MVFARLVLVVAATPYMFVHDLLDKRKHAIWKARFEAARIADAEGE